MVKLPVGEDSALLASLLTLSDVFCTGHHAAVKARVGPRTTVTVIGDGAVGLSAVRAAKRLGADQILLMGRHQERTQLGREFGATTVVAERGPLGTTQAAWSGAGRRRLVPTRARRPPPSQPACRHSRTAALRTAPAASAPRRSWRIASPPTVTAVPSFRWRRSAGQRRGS
jgi:hypothetical protein